MQTKLKLDPSIPSSPVVAVAIEQAKKDGVALPDVKDVYVLDAKTGKPVGTPGEAGLNVFGTVLLGHRQFATDVASGALSEIDRYTGEVIGKLEFSIDDPQNPGKKISLEPHQPGLGIDGKLYVPLFNAKHGHAIAIVDTKQGLSEVGRLQLEEGRQPHIADVSPDGKTLYVSVQTVKPAIVQYDLTKPDLPKTEAAAEADPRVVCATDVGVAATHFGIRGMSFTPKGGTTPEIVFEAQARAAPGAKPLGASKRAEGPSVSADGLKAALTCDDGSNIVYFMSRKSLSEPFKVRKKYQLDTKPYFVKLNQLDDGRVVLHVSMQEEGSVLTLDTTKRYRDARLWSEPLLGEESKGRPVKRMALLTRY
jgi:hypothetical protein